MSLLTNYFRRTDKHNFQKMIKRQKQLRNLLIYIPVYIHIYIWNIINSDTITEVRPVCRSSCVPWLWGGEGGGWRTILNYLQDLQFSVFLIESLNIHASLCRTSTSSGGPANNVTWQELSLHTWKWTSSLSSSSSQHCPHHWYDLIIATRAVICA